MNQQEPTSPVEATVTALSPDGDHHDAPGHGAGRRRTMSMWDRDLVRHSLGRS